MDAFIGQIEVFGFNFTPVKWSQCAGAILPISQHQSLFSLLGAAYGGDGRSSFALPDLRGKVAVNQGESPGSSYNWKMGDIQGHERFQLTPAELPAHTHVSTFTPGGTDINAQVSVSTDAATQDGPSEGAYLARNDGGSNDGTFIYRADPGSGTVKLGGVTGGSGEGGTVEVQSTGANQQIPLFQPTLALNYCIALDGIFPSRS